MGEESTSQTWIDPILFVLSTKCLFLFLLAFSLYLWKTGATFYKRTGFLIISYTIHFLCRFIINLNNITSPPVIPLDVEKVVQSIYKTTLNLIWMALYLLIFKVQEKMLLLQSDNHS